MIASHLPKLSNKPEIIIWFKVQNKLFVRFPTEDKV